MDSTHEPLTNLDKIRTQTQSDPGLMVDLLYIYLDQTPSLINTMQVAVANGDWPLLRAAAHKIKPSFRIVGEAGNGEKIAKEIEQLANASIVSAGEIEPWLKKLNLLCGNIYRELNHELSVLEKMGFTRS
ncbi:MAG: Hpt domain-containing protein [Bacteroidota bacterium]|nr:Hpt domain-containing protein [Ferruginibacter sp.]